MKKSYSVFRLLAGVATGLVITCLAASAADKVVVVPLGGAVGNATTSDVVKGKTFSSRAGKGLTGSLEVRDNSTIYTNSIGMKFSLIPAGSFVMGSPEGTGDATHRPVWPLELGRVQASEPGEPSDERQHVVILTEPFYMQTTEVTQGQWQQVTGTNPSNFTTCGSDCPVEQVSWHDAQDFIDTLNVSEGRTNCHVSPNTCYFLPTESQWEYAARAGTVTALYSGDLTYTSCLPVDPNVDKIAWYCGNAESTTHPVAQKEPNNWGLYDMSGNVWEWTNDWYGTYPDGPVIDPQGAASGSVREIRGGSWRNAAFGVRSADRDFEVPPSYRFYALGFRLALSPSQ